MVGQSVLPFAAQRRLGEPVLVDGLPLLVAHARADERHAPHQVVAPDARPREEPPEVGQLGHLHQPQATLGISRDSRLFLVKYTFSAFSKGKWYVIEFLMKIQFGRPYFFVLKSSHETQYSTR